MESIYEDWEQSTEEEQRVMWRNARYSRLIVSISFAAVSCNSLLYTLEFVQCHLELQESFANTTISRPTLVNGDYYINLEWSPIWEILNVIQFCAVMSCNIIYCGYDGVFLLAILHYSAQFDNLRHKVEALVEEMLNKQCSFITVLSPIIDRLEYLCRYTALIEKIFNIVFLMQIYLTSIYLCLLGYQFVSVLSKYSWEELPQLFFIVIEAGSCLISLFLYCFIAELLRIHSENVFISIYNMKWYELLPCESKLLIMMMIRTEKPINITAGKFHVLSLEYFCSVLKSCASFFSLLLVMRDKFIHD